MADLISRAAAIKAAFKDADEWDGGFNPKHLRAVPAVDAAPVVHARWIASDRYKGYMCCSHCTEAYVAPAWLDEGMWKYCPNCGAKMDGGEGDG